MSSNKNILNSNKIQVLHRSTSILILQIKAFNNFLIYFLTFEPKSHRNFKLHASSCQCIIKTLFSSKQTAKKYNIFYNIFVPYFFNKIVKCTRNFIIISPHCTQAENATLTGIKQKTKSSVKLSISAPFCNLKCIL